MEFLSNKCKKSLVLRLKLLPQSEVSEKTDYRFRCILKLLIQLVDKLTHDMMNRMGMLDVDH